MVVLQLPLRALQSLHMQARWLGCQILSLLLELKQRQTAWPDFELNLLAWLGAADTGFETDLQWISDHVDTEFDMDVHSDEMATRSKELHSILVGLLRNRSLKVLRGVSGRNGYEVYRQLLKLFKPSTRPRAMALLSALMGLPTFGKDKSLYDHIQGT